MEKMITTATKETHKRLSTYPESRSFRNRQIIFAIMILGLVISCMDSNNDDYVEDTVPASPTNVRAELDNEKSNVKVSWDEVRGVKNYWVYRSDCPYEGFVQVANNVYDNYWIDTNPLKGGNYYIVYAFRKLEKSEASTVTDVVCVTANEEHEYVDLGLPSGTLWATCNVGANHPEERGDHFAWGETNSFESGKGSCTQSTYKWIEHEWPYIWLTKYNSSPNYGNIVDDKNVLDLVDDAAYVNWGKDWCMPSKEQFEELLDSNYTIITSYSHPINQGKGYINGWLIKSKMNGNSIFLPPGGTINNMTFSLDFTDLGWFWTNYSRVHWDAVSVHMHNYFLVQLPSLFISFNGRWDSNSVRPVRRNSGR